MVKSTLYSHSILPTLPLRLIALCFSFSIQAQNPCNCMKYFYSLSLVYCVYYVVYTGIQERFFCKIHNYIGTRQEVVCTHYSNSRGCLSTWPFVIGFLVPTHISGQEINFKGRPEMKAESKNRAFGKFFQNQVGQYYFKIDENNALVILNWAYDLSNSQEPPPPNVSPCFREQKQSTHIFLRDIYLQRILFLDHQLVIYLLTL